jgi:hypothetical protein
VRKDVRESVRAIRDSEAGGAVDGATYQEAVANVELVIRE